MISSRIARSALTLRAARSPAAVVRVGSQWTRYKSDRPPRQGATKKTTASPITPDRLSYVPPRSQAARNTTPEQDAADIKPPTSPAPKTQPSERSRTSPLKGPQTLASDVGEFNAKATPQQNTAPETQPGPQGKTGSGRRIEETEDLNKSDEAFTGPQSAEANTTPDEGQPSQQPLPDLRFGIPSTFSQEFMKQATEKGSEADTAHHDVNITEDPAQASTSGGRRGGDGDGELPRSAYETSIDKRRNRMANIMYLMFAVLGSTGAVYFGRNWESEEEERQHLDTPSGWSPGLMWARAKARMSGQMGYYTEPTFPKLLPTMDPAPPYTLVLSLEDLMIHSEWSREHGWRTAKRPGLDYFLRYLSQYYELVLFTSMPFAYADPVARKLDPFHVMMWTLFREGTRYEKGQYIKDLSYLNRDLSKVIILDTKAEHVQAQPENAIVLKPWKGDTKDRDLISYIPFLEYLAAMNASDVRTAIKSFEGTHIPTEYARREAILREAFNTQYAEQKAKKPRVSGVGFLNSALGMKAQSTGLSMDGGVTSVADGLAEGKMLQDQIRERGMREYQKLEQQIRENGESWLKEEAEMEKKAQVEQMKSAKNWAFGWAGKGADEEGSVEAAK